MDRDLSIEIIKIDLLILAGVFTGLQLDFRSNMLLLAIGVSLLAYVIIHCHAILIETIDVGGAREELQKASDTEHSAISNLTGLVFIACAFIVPYANGELETSGAILYAIPYIAIIGVSGIRYNHIRDHHPEYLEELKSTYISFGLMLFVISILIATIGIIVP